MQTIQAEDLLGRLRAGHIDPAAPLALEQTTAGELLAELASVYRLRFQERRLREKWEVGLARSLRHELAVRAFRASRFPVLVLMPVLRNCLLLSGEGETITGVTVIARLIVKPTGSPTPGLALTTGRGFKLEKAPDGWAVKPMHKRTVKLTEEFLQQRGWCFDFLWPFKPA